MASPKKSTRSKAKRDELVGQPDRRAAIDSAALLAKAKPVLKRLEDDLQARALASPAVTAALTARHAAEKAASRTADSFAGWTAALATQVAAAWLLSCVFVRTLEDRGLLKQARLAGPGAEDSQRQFFQLAPSLTERDYLLTVFRELAHHPAAKDLFDAEHSLVWKLSPSAEVAKELLALFRAPTAAEPAFRFGQQSTRFLGDLYQDLSEDVRKRFALLQTPHFVEAYILDHTLEPAIARFGLDDTTLIDPTCGSGHFLLGAFDRLFEHRLRAEPGIDAREAAVKALDTVYGADINPFAVAVARFRLTLAFLAKAGYAKLADAPALPLHLVVADSLRINPQHPQQELWQHAGASSAAWLGDVFAFDDERAAKDVLGRQYAAVVANPPYITVKDAALRETYREMYPRSCFREYSLAAPFCERLFQLARPRGYAGQITANSFMKREFGKALIQRCLPTMNLVSIVNTSGAYIPGHGTPTVLLFGTNEPPQAAYVHAVLAKRGEPVTPELPEHGLVWRSIVDHGDELGFENEFVSVGRIPRDIINKHPWSLGGGGASELKQLLEERANVRLGDLVDSIGFMCITKQDDVFSQPTGVLVRAGVEQDVIGTFVIGEQLRDWAIESDTEVVFPYDPAGHLRALPPTATKFLWPYRAVLEGRAVFGGQTFKQAGRQWYEFGQIPADRVAGSAISFAFVATHNHFVFDRGGSVFNRSAPIIKLPDGATEDDHLALLAYLNSSTACFWMKQVFMNKGATSDRGVLQADEDKFRYEFDGTKLQQLPLPASKSRDTLVALARRVSELASSIATTDYGGALLADGELGEAWKNIDLRHRGALCAAVAAQEEIDWIVYRDFGLISEDILHAEEVGAYPPDARPFVARDASDGGLVRQRWRTAQDVAELTLMEAPEFKRRWYRSQGKFNAEQVDAACRKRDALLTFALDHVERAVREWSEPSSIRPECVTPISRIVVALALVGEDMEPSVWIESIVDQESVPFLASLRFTDTGLEKHDAWHATWELQRREDAGEILDVAVPPKYGPGDFVQQVYFRHRGKLDVPKERFISYPFCESDTDSEPVYGWSGWNHLQRAQALASLYLKRKNVEGWTQDRLMPMLGGLLELIPWVKQWHNGPSPEFAGLQMGDYFAQFLDGECRQHGLTHDDLRAWRPPAKARGKARKTKKAAAAETTDTATTCDEVEAAPKPKKPRAKNKKTATGDAPPVPTEAE
jgi:hypothetical protein